MKNPKSPLSAHFLPTFCPLLRGKSGLRNLLKIGKKRLKMGFFEVF